MDAAEVASPSRPEQGVGSDLMTSFTAADWYEVPGRGRVAYIAGIDGFDPRELTGRQVDIDGKTYTVKGVETVCIHNVAGKPFGLLVGVGEIDRDQLDEWMRDKGLMLIRTSYFYDLTRQLANARQTATRLYEKNDRLRAELGLKVE